MPTTLEIAAAVRSRSLSPVEALEQALARIDAVESQIHAWVEIDREGALQQAKALEATLHEGGAFSGGPGMSPGLQHLPLAGVPVGIKDIVDVAHLPTRLGAPAFAHYTPDDDGTAVARLRAAGAIILGKTHTTEFAYLDPAPTCNPWNRKHTPGGSSSGSAAAVGARTIPFAIGSQTVGSVLRPAAYCGAVGLKPTYGLIPYTGTAALATSFDHLGVLADSVAGAALALGVLAGYDRFDPASVDAPPVDYLASIANPVPPRVGIVRSYYRGHANPEVEQHLEEIARQFAAAGATVAAAEMPGDAATLRAWGDPVMQHEAAEAHARLYAAFGGQYRTSIRTLVEAGQKVSDDAYQAGREAMRRMREGIVAALQGFDVLLLPVAPATAPDSIETTGQGIFCAPASFTGLPAISLPSGLSANGMPLAIQLMAAPLAEATLLRAAAWAEATLNFTAKPDIAP
jgi:Asp-tRNA(Asn)/Glu-tRNA(Gln) amidotransferase A subunit family amidase